MLPSIIPGYLVMAFDTKDLNKPIGMFNQTAQGTPVLTSGNYLNCLNGQQVSSCTAFSKIFVCLFKWLSYREDRMQLHTSRTMINTSSICCGFHLKASSGTWLSSNHVKYFWLIYSSTDSTIFTGQLLSKMFHTFG